MLLDFLKEGEVVGGDQVDGDSLTSETSRSTDSVNIVFDVIGRVVVDDKGDLLDINTTCQQIGGDQNSGSTGSEFSHDQFSLVLIHITMHGGDGKHLLGHLLGQPIDLAASLAVDNGLLDIQIFVQITQQSELLFFLVDGDIELTDTFQSQFFFLDQDSLGVSHEQFGEIQNFLGHGGGNEDNLDIRRQHSEDFLDLVLESSGQHFVGFIQNEQLQAVQFEGLSVDHIRDTSGGTNDNVDTFLEDTHIFHNLGSTNTSVNLDLHEFRDVGDNFLGLLGQFTSGGDNQSLAFAQSFVNSLQKTNGESGSLSSSRLSLGDSVVGTDDRDDTFLLNDGGLDETVSIDTSQQGFFEFQFIETFDAFIPVGLENFIRDRRGGSVF
mmetsp:Transcript_11574/g.12721  ORF Transcript_11574/g.12721 Transcript_11574/m.12721 type:complete len:380 (+) Transcript_11574:1082-2221(+)